MTRLTAGQDRFNQFGWLWRRTHRLALMLFEPRILAGAVQIVEGLDRYAEHHRIPKDQIRVGDAKLVRGLNYIEMPIEAE